MNITIGMIVLNEEEFIEKNLKQHYNWDGADVHQIIIVEGAVKLFPKRNITDEGLSTDRTAEIIRSFPDPDKKIEFIQGYWEDKSHQRNQYAQRVRDDTDYLLVIDADEFYPKVMQWKISQLIQQNQSIHSFLIRQRHIWKPPSLSDSDLFKYEVIGGYWSVPHLRLYKWKGDSRYYENHNELVYPDGHNLHVRDSGFYECGLDIYLVHMGFARGEKFCRDKQDYYYNRGEKITRPMYSDCREAWFTWKKGDALPHGANVISYDGIVPEVFNE